MTCWLARLRLFYDPKFHRSWLSRCTIHLDTSRKCNFSIDMNDCFTRNNIIRSFLSGWSWNEYPNFVLQRKLLLEPANENWAIYSAQFPYVIDYNYTMYDQHASYKGDFLFTNAKDKLLVMECNYVTNDQLRCGGSSITRQKLRHRKRKSLRDKVHTLVQLVHNHNPGIVSTEGVMVTGTEIKHILTLSNDGDHERNVDYPLLMDDSNKPVRYDDWKLSYWPRDTSYNTCTKRDRVLRDYFMGCTWSNNSEFNIIRNFLLYNSSCYMEQYPLFYDYEYVLPLAYGNVSMGDCLFTDGRNNFMAVEVKSLLPGELYNPSRKAGTARKSRTLKRKEVSSQAAYYAKHWHEFNPQVTKTEGFVMTDNGIQHVLTLDRLCCE